jgi:hypothetical protein
MENERTIIETVYDTVFNYKTIDGREIEIPCYLIKDHDIRVYGKIEGHLGIPAITFKGKFQGIYSKLLLNQVIKDFELRRVDDTYLTVDYTYAKDRDLIMINKIHSYSLDIEHLSDFELKIYSSKYNKSVEQIFNFTIGEDTYTNTSITPIQKTI